MDIINNVIFQVVKVLSTPLRIIVGAIGTVVSFIPYAAVGMSTDYDSWREDENPVSWDDILKVFQENVKNMQTLFVEAVRVIGTAD